MIPFRRLPVPLDLSFHSDEAPDCALVFTHTFEGRFNSPRAYHLPIQVATPDRMIIRHDVRTAVRDSIPRRLEKALRRGSASGSKGETHLADLPAAQAMARTAEKIGAGFIVMGVRGWTRLKHALLGSVGERLIRMAPCPVITVKAPEK